MMAYRAILSAISLLGLAVACDAAAPDCDADGVPDANDNCPCTANASQENGDGDSIVNQSQTYALVTCNGSNGYEVVELP